MNDWDITTGDQVDSYLRKYYSIKEYRGLVVDNDIPSLKPGQFVIRNADEHWSVIYNLNGRVKEWDSYGRDLLPNIEDTHVAPQDRQGASGIDNSDCGQRSIAFLIKTFKPANFFKTVI